jgi:hypothetical protein
MASTHTERQAIPLGNCPKNVGNLRQFAWYCRQVSLLIVYRELRWPYYLCFFLNSYLSHRTVILCPHAHSPLLLFSLLLQNFSGDKDYLLPFEYLLHQIPSFFHNSSTRILVFSSINISSGHGRVNPSVAHFRVASTPIFDPKSCIRAA